MKNKRPGLYPPPAEGFQSINTGILTFPAMQKRCALFPDSSSDVLLCVQFAQKDFLIKSKLTEC